MGCPDKSNRTRLVGFFDVIPVPHNLQLVIAILETVRPLATKLQKRDLDVYEARNLVTDRVDRVKEMRVGVDEEFETWYTDGKRIADQLQIEEKVPKPHQNTSNLQLLFLF